MERVLRKRRTREHIIADLSVNHVERFILRAGFTALRETHDYGLDLLMKTFDPDGAVEPAFVLLQLKATDHVDWIDAGRALSVTIDQRDVNVWMGDKYPLILILYDAPRDRAYWLHVQAYVEEWRVTGRWKLSAFRNVRIPSRNRVNVKSIVKFAALKSRMLAARKGKLNRWPPRE